MVKTLILVGSIWAVISSACLDAKARDYKYPSFPQKFEIRKFHRLSSKQKAMVLKAYIEFLEKAEKQGEYQASAVRQWLDQLKVFAEAYAQENDMQYYPDDARKAIEGDARSVTAPAMPPAKPPGAPDTGEQTAPAESDADSDLGSSGSFNCFYAGWPSVLVNGKCTSPKNGNSKYAQYEANCPGKLACNPAFFGPGVCGNFGNGAFASCVVAANLRGHTPQKIVEDFYQKDSALLELLGEADSVAAGICANPVNPKTRPMCGALARQLGEIKESVIAARTAAAATQAAESAPATQAAESAPATSGTAGTAEVAKTAGVAGTAAAAAAATTAASATKEEGSEFSGQMDFATAIQCYHSIMGFPNGRGYPKNMVVMPVSASADGKKATAIVITADDKGQTKVLEFPNLDVHPQYEGFFPQFMVDQEKPAGPQYASVSLSSGKPVASDGQKRHNQKLAQILAGYLAEMPEEFRDAKQAHDQYRRNLASTPNPPTEQQLETMIVEINQLVAQHNQQRGTPQELAQLGERIRAMDQRIRKFLPVEAPDANQVRTQLATCAKVKGEPILPALAAAVGPHLEAAIAGRQAAPPAAAGSSGGGSGGQSQGKTTSAGGR